MDYWVRSLNVVLVLIDEDIIQTKWTQNLYWFLIACRIKNDSELKKQYIQAVCC